MDTPHRCLTSSVDNSKQPSDIFVDDRQELSLCHLVVETGRAGLALIEIVFAAIKRHV